MYLFTSPLFVWRLVMSEHKHIKPQDFKPELVDQTKFDPNRGKKKNESLKDVTKDTSLKKDIVKTK